MPISIEDEEIRDYLIEKYKKINPIVIGCVITHIAILLEFNKFKSRTDIFEEIDSSAFQFNDIIN